MKKHLTSIESTRPNQQRSLFSYHTQSSNIVLNNKVNHKLQLDKMFYVFEQILSLRSYIVFRDIEQVYNSSKQFMQQYLHLYTPQQLYQFAFPHISINQKLYEKQQIQLFANIIFQLNKQKHQTASQSKMKHFQLLKQLINYLQQKSIKYQHLLREKKEKQLRDKKTIEYKEKEREFNKFENEVRQNMFKRHQRIKSSQVQKIHKQQQMNNELYQTLQRKEQKLQYKAKPSKLLSQAKDLSLRVKLSPYASQLKRQHDYHTLQNKLEQTINLDLDRKVAIIDKMKSIEREKRDRQHKKRYSVLEDRLKEDQNLTQRDLGYERSKLQKSFNNQLEQMSNKSKNKRNSLLIQLKNSFNAYNMHSDKKEISKIIKHHRTSLQFETDIRAVGNLRTQSQYEPKYATLTYNMIQPHRLQETQRKQKQRQQKRILRRFSKQHNQNLFFNQIATQKNREQEEYDLINTSINTKKIKRQKSLVALYDNQLEEQSNK